MQCSLIDTPASLSAFIDSLASLPNSPPFLYCDLEGAKLSRHGTISILTLLVQPTNHTYLIDSHTLHAAAFTTAGTTLKSILESPTIPKVFFDVRNDSDALFAHFAIALASIQDIQLMENAARTGGSERLLNGLARCIEQDAYMTAKQKRVWKVTKDAGQRLFPPELGGSYEVFDVRPLADAVQQYCAQDVQYLPELREIYWGRLDLEWMAAVRVETEKRVRLSQSKGYQPHGSHKALGPW